MIPIKKGIESTGQPAVSIESGDSTIPRKPILVEGGPAPTPVAVTPLSVTENGTYDAGENAAYNPVTVNVDKSKPDEVELVNFDFKNSSLLDKIRNYSVPASNYRNISTTNDGLLLNGTNAYCNLAFVPETYSFYEIKIKFGTNSDTSGLSQYNGLFTFNRTDNHQTLTYCRDIQIDDNPMGTWRISDESGRITYLTIGYGDSHYFDNKELIVRYGYYLNNGVFTLNLSKFSYSIGDTNILIGNANFEIGQNSNPVIILGAGQALKGTIFESVKIKQIFKWNLDRNLFKKSDLELEESEVE